MPISDQLGRVSSRNKRSVKFTAWIQACEIILLPGVIIKTFTRNERLFCCFLNLKFWNFKTTTRCGIHQHSITAWTSSIAPSWLQSPHLPCKIQCIFVKIFSTVVESNIFKESNSLMSQFSSRVERSLYWWVRADRAASRTDRSASDLETIIDILSFTIFIKFKQRLQVESMLAFWRWRPIRWRDSKFHIEIKFQIFLS